VRPPLWQPSKRASGTDTLHAAAFGPPEAAWEFCAGFSAETESSTLTALTRPVLLMMPTKYEDIWTAAKGFYKLEPIVADGGELII
jgi:lactate racemase